MDSGITDDTPSWQVYFGKYFIGKLQSSMVIGLLFACMRKAATLGWRIVKSRHFSEPAVFVDKVAKRQKKK